MKVRMNFAHRIDMWDDDGENIVEQLAGIEDCEYSNHRVASRSISVGPSILIMDDTFAMPSVGRRELAAAIHVHDEIALFRDEKALALRVEKPCQAVAVLSRIAAGRSSC